MQLYPKSTAHPVHPSFGVALPSSHASSLAFLPSPQLDLHTLGAALPHVYPKSTVQLVHPSFAVGLPSSHVSVTTSLQMIPSPHAGEHTLPVHTSHLQSVLLTQLLPARHVFPQAGPPQSTSVSLPFFTPSLHSGILQTCGTAPRSHTRLSQSLP